MKRLFLFLLIAAGSAFGQANIYSPWPNFPQNSSFFPIGTFLQNPNATVGGSGPHASQTTAQAMKAMHINIAFDIDGGSGGAGWPCSFGTDCGAGSNNQFANLVAQGLYVMPQVDYSSSTSATSVASVQAIASAQSASANLIGYILGDEPGCSVSPSVATRLADVTAYDNTRPTNWNLTDYIYNHGICSPSSINSGYLQAMNIGSYDNYSMVIKYSTGWGVPIVSGQPTDYLYMTPWSVAAFIAAGNANQPIWFYGDDGADELAGNSGCSGNLCGSDNHELRATPEQVNAEMWAGLINGAMGLVEFCHDTTWGEPGCMYDATTANNLTYINSTVLNYAPELNSAVSGVCTMETGPSYTNFGTSCTNGILTMASATTATSSVTASESGTTATFTAGSSWGAAYVVNSPVAISGCSVSGYNTTSAIQTVSGTSLTVTVGSSLGAATGCTVTSKVPGSAIVKTHSGTPYLFADTDRNGQATMTFTLTGYAGHTATVVYDSNAQYDPTNSSVGNTFTLNGSGQFSDTFGTNGHNYQPKIYSLSSTTQAATPTFSPVAGTYVGTQSVIISTATVGATICWTSDGSTPTANGAGTCTHGTTYTSAVSVTVSETLKAMASLSGDIDSAVGSAAYVITSSVFALTVTVAGSGAVTSSPTGINCPGTCSANFASGANVTLTPVATAGSLFINWSTCSFSGTCVVTMSAAEAVTANFCQPIAPAYCNNQTGQSTSFSIASSVVTINASNTAPSGAYFGLSQFTHATQLNGRVLLTNGSTTTSKLVGTLYNVQGTALAPANVSNTADTTGFIQGQGWQPFYTAPFPAPLSTNCTLGNGDPGCTLPAAASGFGPNTWAFDFATPCGTYGVAPCTPMVMLADTSFTTSHQALVPSLAGETNERDISLSDGSTPPNYMYTLNHSGHLEAYSGHIDPTYCNGVPCFISDVQGEANSWTLTPINYGIFSQVSANRPGPHKALRYTLNLNSTCNLSAGLPAPVADCSIAPVLQTVTLQYSVGLPNCASSSVNCVTAISTVNTYALNTCPGYGHLFVGNGLAVASQPQIDDFDDKILIGVAGGNQGSIDRHNVFVISMANGTCTQWDTGGFTGTALFDLQDASGHDGSGYAVGDTFSFTEVGGVCASTGTVTTISGGGGTGPVSKVAIGSGAASGCYLARGFTTTTTSGSGSGLEVDITGVGTPGTFSTTWAPIAAASCPAGNNTTLTCETAVTSTYDAYGIHNCSMQANGIFLGCSGWGPTGQGCAGCDFVDWQIGTANLYGSADATLNGHGARGYAFSGNSANPNLWESKPPNGTTNTSCTNPSFCYQLYSLPNNGCANAPGGSQMHGYQPTTFMDDSQPYYVTSSINSPGVPAQNNPPGFTCAFGQQSLFTVTKSPNPGVILGNATWYTHWYENTNNAVTSPTENFEGFDNIMACAPDGAFCIVATDMNTNFAGNVGLGFENAGDAYVGAFSVTIASSAPPPPTTIPVLFRGGVLQ